MFLIIFIATLAGTLLVQMYLRNTYNRWGQEMTESSDGRVLTSAPIPLGDVSVRLEKRWPIAYFR